MVEFLLNKENLHAYHCLVTRCTHQRHHSLDAIRRILIRSFVMLRKLIVFAITSGLAAKLLKKHFSRQDAAPVNRTVTRRRRAGTAT